MSELLNLPDKVASATVRRWCVEPGQAAAAGDLLCVADTEETLVEVRASRAVTVAKILCPAGQTVTAGQALAELGDGMTDTASATDTSPAPQPAGAPAALPPEASLVIMPKAGQTMEEGTIVNWLVAEGDPVAKGQAIFEVETDKAVIEVEAHAVGVLAKILVPAGETVPVMDPVAVIAPEGVTIDAAAVAGGAPAQAAPAEAAPTAPAAPAAPAALPEGVSFVLMPKAGQTMEEGTVVGWKVAEGDTVAKGAVLYEVETDKAVIEVEANAAGQVLKILVGDGETVPVKVPVAIVGPAGTDVDAILASVDVEAPIDLEEQMAQQAAGAGAPAAPAAAAPAAAPTRAPGERVFASPAARRVAKELGVELATVQGTGAEGRVKAADVEAAAKAPKPAAKPAPAAAPAELPSAPAGEPRRIELTRMRRAIAQNLSWSKQNIPHFYGTITIDAGPMRQAHKFIKKALGSTMNDLVVAGVAKTIAEFPELRCRFEDGAMIELPTVNVGIAVGTDDGLRVPVLPNADQLSLSELSKQARAIVSAARDNRMSQPIPASFTITNMGMFGIHEFGAIINPPESAILAVGAARQEPVVKNGQVVPGDVMTLTLSCDHRIVDGMVAAKFLGRLKERLEDVETLLEETR